MANLLLPILAGELPSGYCFTSWQQLLVDFADNTQAQLANGRAYYNIGDTKPDPQYQAYPWLRTTDGRWYVFQGKWRSPMNRDANERQLFIGTLTELQTYDGGDTGTVGPMSGPAWQEDTDFRGRSPIGPGALPSSDPAVTIAVATDYGAGSHAITSAEGGVQDHTHAFGVANSSSDDAFFSKSGLNTVQAYNGFYITGSNGTIQQSQTTADLVTLKSGADGAGVTDPDPVSLLHPVRGIYVIKPTSRQYYVVP